MGYYVDQLDYTQQELIDEIKWWQDKASKAREFLKQGASIHWQRELNEAKYKAQLLERELSELQREGE